MECIHKSTEQMFCEFPGKFPGNLRSVKEKFTPKHLKYFKHYLSVETKSRHLFMVGSKSNVCKILT